MAATSSNDVACARQSRKFAGATSVARSPSVGSVSHRGTRRPGSGERRRLEENGVDDRENAGRCPDPTVSVTTVAAVKPGFRTSSRPVADVLQHLLRERPEAHGAHAVLRRGETAEGGEGLAPADAGVRAASARKTFARRLFSVTRHSAAIQPCCSSLCRAG